MRKVLIIGSNGLVGKGVSDFFENTENVQLTKVDMCENFDLRDKQSIKKYLKSKSDIEYIVNCSGINDHVDENDSLDSTKTDLDNMDLFFDINVKSVCRIIEYSKENLNNLKGVINFASLYGIRSPFHPIYDKPKSLSYTVSKHALEGITKYYAALYGKNGITINAIRIGGIEANQSKRFKEWFTSRTPLGRMANLKDLYGTINLLCSEEGSYITGQSITVDGGYTSW